MRTRNILTAGQGRAGQGRAGQGRAEQANLCLFVLSKIK